MARYVALAFALGLLAGPAAAWGPLNPDCNGELGQYSTSDANAMAAMFLQGVPAGTISVTGATLIGADYQSGIVDYCQGPFYNSLTADTTTDNTEVLVFTTGYGQLPATVPANGASPDGNDWDNFAANDRFAINTCQAGAAGLPGLEDGCVPGTNTQAFGNICPGGQRTFDASGLTIEFVAEKSATFSFNYIWGSEEYPEYVGRAYTDQFRFLVRREAAGDVVQDWTNIAKVNGQDVGINTVNSDSNSDSFVLNPYSQVDQQTAEPTQYDGFTKLLKTETVTFKAGETVKLALVVSDCSDRLLDSMVMIETGSVQVNPEPACAGITFVPNPSAVGAAVEITSSYTDSDIVSIQCSTTSGASFSCEGNTLVFDGTTASCTGTVALAPEDYAPDGKITCVGQDSIGQAVTCEASPEIDPVPTCAGIIFGPNPSSPGDEVSVAASFSDNSLNTVTCTFPSGASFSCTKEQLVVVGLISTCSGSVTLGLADYSAPVSCIGADMSGQTVDCQATPEQVIVPSPAPLVPSPSIPVPLPSPKAPPMPSPAVPVPVPSPAVPVPVPSPAVPVPPPSPIGCDVPKPDPVPPVGCPATDPNCNPSAANCTTYNPDLTFAINGPLTVSCSKCQWECLTNPSFCGGITLYNDPEVIDFVDLATYNCGDGGFGGSLFAPLCVLETGAGVYADVQNQPCFNCKQQCEAWEQCTGVYFEYNYYSKENLGNMCC